MVELHNCPSMVALFATRDLGYLMGGHAFEEIVRHDDVWYAADDHNGTRVFYCPFCGMKLPDPAPDLTPPSVGGTV
jgi:hypothetical protein